MDIQVYRVSKSSYQDNQFFNYEKEKLESIPGVKYVSSITDFSPEIPFILLTNTHTNPKEIPDVILKKTIMIIHANSGYDNFDLDFIRECNIPIILGNSIRSHAVVEYILSCIFNEFTKIPDHKHWSASRVWKRPLLKNQKVLILGYGHIGKLLYSTFSSLCKDVKVYDPYVNYDLISFDKSNIWDDDFLQNVSILIIACGLNKENYHFIDSKKLKHLDSEALIINAARGEIIKQEDLIQFLQKNPSSKCYQDVFEIEPFPPGYLHDIKNLNKTSHIAGVYQNLNFDIVDYEYQTIMDFINRYKDKKMDLFFKEYKDSILKNKIINDTII